MESPRGHTQLLELAICVRLALDREMHPTRLKKGPEISVKFIFFSVFQPDSQDCRDRHELDYLSLICSQLTSPFFNLSLFLLFLLFSFYILFLFFSDFEILIFRRSFIFTRRS